MTREEYRKCEEEWLAKRKAAVREILEILIKHSLTAAEAGNILDAAKETATRGAMVTEKVTQFWADEEITE